MTAMWRMASCRTASLSYLVATARWRLSRLIPHSTACRAFGPVHKPGESGEPPFWCEAVAVITLGAA